MIYLLQTETVVIKALSKLKNRPQIRLAAVVVPRVTAVAAVVEVITTPPGILKIKAKVIFFYWQGCLT